MSELWYPLVNIYKKLLKMAIDFVDLPSYKMVIFNSYVKLPKSTRKHWKQSRYGSRWFHLCRNLATMAYWGSMGSPFLDPKMCKFHEKSTVLRAHSFDLQWYHQTQPAAFWLLQPIRTYHGSDLFGRYTSSAKVSTNHGEKRKNQWWTWFKSYHTRWCPILS